MRWSLSDLFKRWGSPRTQLGMPNALSGFFEFRVDRLVGTVTDGFGTEVTDIQVAVLHRGELIESFAATPQREHGRFVFSFPIDGRFTGAELVREQVTLLATDSNGNRGRLRLDGAAQLELLRDHLGVPAVTVFDLEFSRGGNAKPFLGAGWSYAETNFTWTEDDDSFVGFETPADPGIYALRMTAGHILNKPEVTSQELKTFINGTQVDQAFFNQPFVQFREIRFPHEEFGVVARTTLCLHHPNAIRPSDIGPSKDRRRLAFNFKRLSLVRLLPAG